MSEKPYASRARPLFKEFDQRVGVRQMVRDDIRRLRRPLIEHQVTSDEAGHRRTVLAQDPQREIEVRAGETNPLRLPTLTRPASWLSPPALRK
jgi:hypothetical protein